MKNLKLILLIGVLYFNPRSGSSQINIEEFVDYFDSAGFVIFLPSTTEHEEPWNIYQNLSSDTLNSLVLVREYPETLMGLTHSRYQQYFKGLPIEVCYYSEHYNSDDGYLVFSNGRLAQIDDDRTAVPSTSESAAIETALNYYSGSLFAWNDEDWMTDLVESSGDPNATYFPIGELVWAIDDFTELPLLVPDDRVRLSWKFKILSIDPFFYKSVFVDALTGDVWREDYLIKDDGPANVTFHGTQTIDTEWTGAINRHILHATGNGRDYHTKKGEGLGGAWGLAANYNDPDDIWGAGDEEGTTTHWFIGQSLDYFDSDFARDINSEVIDGEIRISANMADGSASTFLPFNSPPRLYFGSPKNEAIDAVGHEVTHLLASFSDLANFGEPSTLEESFADIFGEMIEEFAEGTTIDWIHVGDPTNLDAQERRSFLDPNSMGRHTENNDCDDFITGQADTYLGDLWQTDACDNSGIHANCGVQNFWFYLLCNGGSGVNDISNTYNVSAISVEDAAQIAYLNLTTVLSGADGFEQAREGSLIIAGTTWGWCSPQFDAVQKAWYAVGLGTVIPCPPISVQDGLRFSNKPKIAPNPTNGLIKISIPNGEWAQQFKMTTLDGLEVLEDYEVNASSFIVNLGNLPSGIYIIETTVRGNLYFDKIVVY